MKILSTFSLSTIAPPPGLLGRIAETPAPLSHAVGVTSGVTGLALWAEMAQHLTVLMGLAVAFVALVGGAFYALYWGMKVIQKWRELRAPVPVPVKSSEAE